MTRCRRGDIYAGATGRNGHGGAAISSDPLIYLGLAAANAALAAALIVALRPLMARYAMARPNARSLHAAPTPQGGGIAIVAALALTLGALALVREGLAPLVPVLLAVSVAVAAIGGLDDVAPLPSGLRLALQIAAVYSLMSWFGEDARILPDILPAAAERLLLVLALAWFVNLVNFMDGMDWMTVVEMAPLSAALAAFALAGVLPFGAGAFAAALLGGLIGFAPFNRPVARLFLGDVGSLPIGLIVGLLLVILAMRGHLAAALLLPLYYIADSGITLAWRLRRGERVWEAHRCHFYQVAVARGMGVRAVLARVFALNLALVALASASLGFGAAGQAGCVALGAAAVAAVLRRLARSSPASGENS